MIDPNAAQAQALQNLCPGAQWYSTGPNYADIVWVDTKQTMPTQAAFDAAVIAVSNPPPKTVLSQDLMAQFTAADAALIQTAVSGDVQFWLLWSAMQAQKDPMIVTNARFMAGWVALVQVLGQPRMTAIATALGITVA